MPRLPKGKRQLNVYISSEILEIFRDICKKKHQDEMYGLSAETEDAIRLWIKEHTYEHTLPLRFEKVNPAPRIFQKWMAVRRRLEAEYGGELPHQVTRGSLEEAIIKEIGSDQRTVRKYFQTFKRIGVIKFIAAGIVEVVG